MPTIIPLPRDAAAIDGAALLQPATSSPPACFRPLFGQSVPAGFPSPATDYIERSLDLNTYLVRNPASTFYFRVHGDSMTGAHIFDRDMLAVDRSITPQHRHIVLAVVNDEYAVKRLYMRAGTIELRAENPAYAPIQFKDFEELQIWVVVVGTVCRFVV